MRSYLILSFIAVLCVAASCKRKDNQVTFATAESITIARHPGFAPTGTLLYFFHIDQSGAYQDTAADKPGSNPSSLNYDYQLSADKYNQVKSILTEVPSTILEQNGAQYRDPNIADCSFSKVTAVINGTTYNWTFEECTDAMPEEVKAFAEKVKHTVNTLK